jgi:hypothetical protein
MTVTLVPRTGERARSPRDILELSGAWTLEAVPKAIEARLFWFTRGKGTEEVGVCETQVVDLPTIKGARAFKFALPVAPYSFSGRLISLRWAVELVADDTVARWEFTMSPDGAEITLSDAGDAARS